jgi:hypothetical protein
MMQTTSARRSFSSDKWRLLRAGAWALAVVAPLAVSTARCRPRDTPSSSSVTPAAPLRPVAGIKQIMAGLIDPGADLVWESVATTITRSGTEERRPRSDEEWVAVRNAALQLTEGGNLLMLGDRAKDRDAWWRMSRALVDAGAVALAAAERKNAEALFDSGEAITTACDNCHSVYWKDAGSLQ